MIPMGDDFLLMYFYIRIRQSAWYKHRFEFWDRVPVTALREIVVGHELKTREVALCTPALTIKEFLSLKKRVPLTTADGMGTCKLYSALRTRRG